MKENKDEDNGFDYGSPSKRPHGIKVIENSPIGSKNNFLYLDFKDTIIVPKNYEQKPKTRIDINKIIDSEFEKNYIYNNDNNLQNTMKRQSQSLNPHQPYQPNDMGHPEINGFRNANFRVNPVNHQYNDPALPNINNNPTQKNPFQISYNPKVGGQGANLGSNLGNIVNGGFSQSLKVKNTNAPTFLKAKTTAEPETYSPTRNHLNDTKSKFHNNNNNPGMGMNLNSIANSYERADSKILSSELMGKLNSDNVSSIIGGISGSRRNHNINNMSNNNISSTPVIKRESNNKLGNVNNNNKMNFAGSVEHRKTNFLDDLINQPSKVNQSGQKGLIDNNLANNQIINNNYNKIQINNVNNIINNIYNSNNPEDEDLIKKAQTQSPDLHRESLRNRPLKVLNQQATLLPMQMERKDMIFDQVNAPVVSSNRPSVDVMNTSGKPNEFQSRRQKKVLKSINNQDASKQENSVIGSLNISNNNPSHNSPSQNINKIAVSAIVDEGSLDTLKIIKMENSRRRTKINL